jgi:hypothetical protein
MVICDGVYTPLYIKELPNTFINGVIPIYSMASIDKVDRFTSCELIGMVYVSGIYGDSAEKLVYVVTFRQNNSYKRFTSKQSALEAINNYYLEKYVPVFKEYYLGGIFCRRPFI